MVIVAVAMTTKQRLQIDEFFYALHVSCVYIGLFIFS